MHGAFQRNADLEKGEVKKIVRKEGTWSKLFMHLPVRRDNVCLFRDTMATWLEAIEGTR